MSTIKPGVIQAVEVMLNRSLSRLDDLKGKNRESLYDEFKEWIEVDEDNAINDDVLYINYLGYS
tara:strand:- start:3021 stop:3212 length:192 start_codon:yes stop_codon:yes gene_type:complete